MASKYLTTGDVARMCDVTANGVIKWINAGKLKAFRTPGGQRRIRQEDFLEFVHHFNYPVDTNMLKSQSQPRILMVDDNRAILDLLKNFFLQKGEHQILTARNGYEACIKFGSFSPALVILDIKMPQVDGFEVLRQIRSSEQGKKAQVIILTGLKPDLVRQRLEEDIPIMNKPVNLEELYQLASRCLRTFSTR